MIKLNNKPANLSSYDVVFCDSLQALDWAYANGLPKSATIKTSSPAMLWKKAENFQNIESRWSVKELGRFQGDINKLIESVFDKVSSCNKFEREIALTASRSVYQFQKILYKAACLESDDFCNSRLFIRVNGKTGPAGNIMNSPWDKLLSSNKLFSVVDYRLQDDKWNLLTTQGVSLLRRLKIAGYETIIFRLALKVMDKLPRFIFNKELLMPDENELNIEVAARLIFKGVKLSKVELKSVPAIDKDVNFKSKEIYELIYPIIQKRIEKWVVPSAMKATMSMFKVCFEEDICQFKSYIHGWDEAIEIKSIRRNAVLAGALGNYKGYALAYICNKKSIPLASSQHGVTIEISKGHQEILPHTFDSNASDIQFSFNSKIASIQENTRFNKSKHYVVGMPLRLLRMKNMYSTRQLGSSIVYISTNFYHMGFSLALKTDYKKSLYEKNIVEKVLNRLPHKVQYKTYPVDNRRYADPDPILSSIKKADNIELFSEKIDMRYLIYKHRVLVTTCATSTLSWPIMSGKPVIFINQKENSPLSGAAHASLSSGIFVFDDVDPNFHENLKRFLSKSIDEIERLWDKKKNNRERMIKDYFSEYDRDAGVVAAKILYKKYLS